MKRLTRAPNLALATLWADLLSNAGIAATVQRMYASSIAGELPPDQALPEVWITDDAELERARALLARPAPSGPSALGLPRLRRDRRRAVRAVLELRRRHAGVTDARPSPRTFPGTRRRRAACSGR